MDWARISSLFGVHLKQRLIIIQIAFKTLLSNVILLKLDAEKNFS